MHKKSLAVRTCACRAAKQKQKELETRTDSVQEDSQRDNAQRADRVAIKTPPPPYIALCQQQEEQQLVAVYDLSASPQV